MTISRTCTLDPVGPLYAIAEKWLSIADVLGWGAAGAFATYALLHVVGDERGQFAKLFFIALMVASLAIGYWVRFDLEPNADRERRRLLVSSAFGASLAKASQVNYYNNDEPPSARRLLFILLENTFFYPRLLKAQLKGLVLLGAIALICLAVAIRLGTPEMIELVALLVLFAEFGLGRLIRTYWAMNQFRALHERVEGVLQSNLVGFERAARILFSLAEYEYIKGRAGVRANAAIFARFNPALSHEWEAYRERIKASTSSRQ